MADLGEGLIGRRIEVFWQGTEHGDVWYGGKIVGFADGVHHIVYDDGDEDDYRLPDITYRLIADAVGGAVGAKETHFVDAEEPRARRRSSASRRSSAAESELETVAEADEEADTEASPQRSPSETPEVEAAAQDEEGSAPPTPVPAPNRRAEAFDRRRPETSFEGRKLDRTLSSRDRDRLRGDAGGSREERAMRRIYSESPGSWAAKARPITAPELLEAQASRAEKESDAETSAGKSADKSAEEGTGGSGSERSGSVSPVSSFGASRTLDRTLGDTQTTAAMAGEESEEEKSPPPSPKIRQPSPPKHAPDTEIGSVAAPSHSAVGLSHDAEELYKRQSKRPQLARGNTSYFQRDIGSAGREPLKPLGKRYALPEAGADVSPHDGPQDSATPAGSEDASQEAGGGVESATGRHPDEPEPLTLGPHKGSFLQGEESAFAPDAAVPHPPVPAEAALITELEKEIKSERVADYTQEFMDTAAPAEVLIGMVSREEALRRERGLEQARFEAAQEEAKKYHEREVALAKAEDRARRRVVELEKQSQARMQRREAQAAQRARLREQSLHRVFARAEAHLKTAFKRQKAIVHERFGALEAGRAGARKLKVAWEEMPQPIEIRVERIRALKDRVPKGKYVLLMTPYDRLGGEPLAWSKLGQHGGAGAQHSPATHPKHHHGRFYDTDLVINDNVYAVAPSPATIHPSNVFILELFLLGTRKHPVDRVVAWGVLPMCDADFQVVSGVFQLPLLSGEVDLNIEKFGTMENMVARDLTTWLANIYLEVRHLPRKQFMNDEHDTMGEFDVEIAKTSEMLRLPRDLKARNAGLIDVDSDDSSDSGYDEEDRALMIKDIEGEEESKDAPMADPHGYTVTDSSASGLRNRKARGADTTHGTFLGSPTRTVGTGGKPPLSTHSQKLRTAGSSRALKIGAARAAGGSMRGFGSFHDMSDVTPAAAIKRTDLAAATGSAKGSGRAIGSGRDSIGRFSRARSDARSEAFSEHSTKKPKVTTDFGGSAVGENGVQVSALAGKASYAVSRLNGRVLRRHALSDTARKWRYLNQELFADLRPSQIQSSEFGIQLLSALVAIWIRVYIHYLGQWLYLRTINVPIYEFRPLSLYMVVKYVSEVLPSEVEIAVTIMGQLTVILFLLAMVFTAWLSERVLGHFPEASSRFIAFFGIGACFDSVLVAIVDLIFGNWNCSARCIDVSSTACTCSEGDAFRLYYRFERDEGSGIVGGFLTAFLFCALFMLAAFVLYVYLLHVHLDGRMLDVYRRLNGLESAFFVPQDFEVAPAELRWILSKAEKWTGANGVRKRVAVCEYELTDPLDPAFKETTTHLIIYKAKPQGGAREMHRHFLRQHDGSILEMFGSFDKHFGKRFKELESLLVSHGKEDSDDVARFFEGLDA